MKKILAIIITSLALIYTSVIPLTWDDLSSCNYIYLYAGDVPKTGHYKHCIGLSLTQKNQNHINHDITNPMPLPDNCIDRYQSEDVFEHIEYEKLVAVINDIYRALKPGGLLRISMPDYRCDYLYNRAWKDENGHIFFDPGGGGKYRNGKVIKGGHLWFPTIEQVTQLLEQTKFHTHRHIEYLHYYDIGGKSITNPIDYSLGYISRTPDHDRRVQTPYRAMSIVVDLYKE